jgi:predicted nucleic acid-binding protein
MNIVVDSNIVFSAMLNTDGNLSKILLLTFEKLTFYSTTTLSEELFSNSVKLKNIGGYNEYEFFRLYNLLTKNINFINPSLIPKENFMVALNLTKNVDVDDTEFVALTDYLEGKLWTGDKKLISGMQKQNWNKFIGQRELLGYTII